MIRTRTRGVALRTSIALIAFIMTAPGILRGQSKGQELAWARADSIVMVGSGRIRLRVYAWRDFMPSPEREGDGSDLMVNLQVASLGAAPLPRGLVVDSAWVHSSEGLWKAAPSHEVRPDVPNGLDLMLRGGPRWATDQTVPAESRHPTRESLGRPPFRGR